MDKITEGDNVPRVLIGRIRSALESGRDNTSELYNEHLNKCGGHRMSPREKELEDYFLKEIDEFDSLIEELK